MARLDARLRGHERRMDRETVSNPHSPAASPGSSSAASARGATTASPPCRRAICRTSDKPEPGARVVLAEPVERREHALALGLRDARPGIDDVEDGARRRSRRTSTSTGGAPWRRAFSSRLRISRRSSRASPRTSDRRAVERAAVVARAFLGERAPAGRRPRPPAAPAERSSRLASRISSISASSSAMSCSISALYFAIAGFLRTARRRAGCATAACAARARHCASSMRCAFDQLLDARGGAVEAVRQRARPRRGLRP